MGEIQAVGRVRNWRTMAAASGAVILAGVAVCYAASTVVVDTMSVRLRVVQSEFPDGFDSGWHTHPGPVFVQVREGNFKIYQGGCEPHVVHEGETYMEVPFVPVRAVAKGPIAWTTSQILPGVEPPQTATPGPCD